MGIAPARGVESVKPGAPTVRKAHPVPPGPVQGRIQRHIPPDVSPQCRIRGPGPGLGKLLFVVLFTVDSLYAITESRRGMSFHAPSIRQ